MFELIPFALLAAYGVLLVLDHVAPARKFERVKGWRVKGLVSFVLYVAVAMTAPMLWDGSLGQHRLIDATGLGTWAGAAVGFLVLELGVYAWHRTMHRVDFLWRWFHQMHHSAERVDVYGAFFFSPYDMVAFTFVTSAALVWAVGVTPEAAAVANGIAGFYGTFQHANLKTPRWLGWIIQRPESHSVHHQRGIHAFNYSDFPLWDVLFGTFHNPATWEGVGGFWHGASARLGAMLLGRDVSRPPVGALTPQRNLPRPSNASVNRRSATYAP